MIRPRVVGSIFRRDFVGYFSSPTGYLFITVFILLSGFALYWRDDFFRDNLANLNTLNALFPTLLLFIVPAISMSAWADERRQGVDELLLTLPVRDVELVAGKYLAALGIYTVCLLFSLSHVLFLSIYGSPDPGLMFANYFAFWCLGAALLAVGMVGSIVTDNLTVGFILGAIFCAIPIYCDERLARALPDWLGVLRPAFEAAGRGIGAVPRFEEMTTGAIPFSSIVYFASIGAVMLYLNLVLVARRRWSVPLFGAHVALRASGALVALASLVVMLGRTPIRVDTTAERLHSLSRVTRDIIREVDPSNPVYIQAYVSPDVPRGYAETRANLLNLLREYAAIGGDRIRLNVVETKRFTEEAHEAEERFGIAPVTLTEERGGRTEEVAVYLGAAVTCGADEVVTPFFFRNISVEYELTRSIRTVSRPAAAPAGAGTDAPGDEREKPNRLKVGILETDAKVGGGFDMQTFRSQPEWELSRELKRQYEVVQVPARGPYPADLSVLVAVLPSSLPQPELDALLGYVRRGKPVLVLDDPMPLDVQGGAASVKERGGQRNPFQPQQQPQEPKGNINDLMVLSGIRWDTAQIAWDEFNPHPALSGVDPEILFVTAGNGAKEPFNPNELSIAGLQEMVFLFPGCIEPRGTPGVNFIPLVTSGKNSGTLRYDEVLTTDFFGSRMNRARRHISEGRELTLAARITGTVNMIFVADVDLIGSQFFEMRREGLRRAGTEHIQFDNVTFILNCIDQLAGDEAYIELRKRRRAHRVLDALEKERRVFDEQQLKEQKEAEDKAEAELKRAQEHLDAEVKAIGEREGLDETTKEIMVAQKQQVEQKLFEQKKKQVEDEKERRVNESRARANREIERIQNRIRRSGTFVPPLPALLVGAIVAFLRWRRERGLASGDRWVGGRAGGAA